MFKQIVTVVCALAVCAILVSASQYGSSGYGQGYEQAQQQQASYEQEQGSYPAPAPRYQMAPAYKPQASYMKYSAPSSARHSQYDNYYPKQSYNQASYAPPKYMSAPAPAPVYRQTQPTYMQTPMQKYSAPQSYESAEYRA